MSRHVHLLRMQHSRNQVLELSVILASRGLFSPDVGPHMHTCFKLPKLFKLHLCDYQMCLLSSIFIMGDSELFIVLVLDGRSGPTFQP
jgi:hypothetical protein